MRIGMVGAGAQGGTLAKQLAKAGHEVRVANRRGPPSLQEFAKQTGTIASTLEDAATKSELIIVALPFKNNANLPKPLFKDLPDSTAIVPRPVGAPCTHYTLGPRFFGTATVMPTVGGDQAVGDFFAFQAGAGHAVEHITSIEEGFRQGV